MGKDFHRNKGGKSWNKSGGGGGGRRDKAPEVDSSDPVQVMFSEISVYLDSRHDKKERIVKLSRDITIESKRIIFCLHRIRDEADPSREAILEEADTRLQEVRENLWRQVAKEIETEDHHQYLRAYSAGLQEWIEALSFYHFLRNNKIISYEEVSMQLVFEESNNVNVENKTDTPADTITMSTEDSIETSESQTKPSFVTIPPSEFILGIADLTGELMRNAINALGAGNMEVCFTLLEILQCMAEGFGQIDKKDAPRDFGQKLWTLKQSCKKVEAACYAISVRGSEIPKNHLADIFVKRDDERENFGQSDDFFCD